MAPSRATIATLLLALGLVLGAGGVMWQWLLQD
jgi:hypothetical protein